jgi:hypothetical protein
VGLYDGAFLPSTAYYSFRAVGTEPLVRLRVVARTDPAADVMTRVDPFENDAKGLYKGQPIVELVMHDDLRFG